MLNLKSNKIKKLKIGAHFSIANGIENSIKKALSLECNVLQIFTKNARRWYSPALKDENINKFLLLSNKHDLIIASHAIYLINLANNEKEKRNLSIKSFIDEIKRCSLLNIPYLIIHPGNAKGISKRKAIINIADAINMCLEEAENKDIKILLETTSGQGNCVGHKFEQLRDIIDLSKYKNMLGVCFDTCHVFSAGYDIKTEKGYKDTINEFDKIIGIKNINFFHLNDSKGKLNSKIDRHEHIGKGQIGIDLFKNIINDKRFINIGKCLETPKGNNDEYDKINLNILKNLTA